MLEGVSLSWLKDAGIVSLCLLFVVMLATNRLYTAGQVNKMLEGFEKMAETWQEVDKNNKETILLLSKSLDPLIQGNEAILRILESRQEQQSAPRQRTPPRRAG